MYPSSIAVLLPERKRSRTDDSVHAEGSGSQSDLSISNNPTNAVNDMTAVTSVTQSATVAVGQRRFPASAMRPRVNPRDADLDLRPGMFKSDSEFYLACSDRRREAIRQWYLQNLLFLHNRLLLEVISEDWQRCFRLKSAADRVGPHSNGEYLGMILSAANPTAPFVALSPDHVFMAGMYVDKECNLVPQDQRFIHQAPNDLRYRDYIARMLDRYRQHCGPWTNVSPYHSFVPIPALTPPQRRVLNEHIDLSILLLLGYTHPEQTHDEIKILREARELQRSICVRALLGELANNAILHHCDIEPLFESFAVVNYDTEGSVSDEDTSDDVDIGTFRLGRLLRSYHLIPTAGVLCSVVREMTSEQYVIPLAGYIVPPKGQPFAWDLFGHFALAAEEKARLLVASTGHAHLLDDLGIEPEFLVHRIMRELSPVVEHHGGGRSYASRRRQLLITFDLDQEADQILRDFIWFRSYMSPVTKQGDCETEFIQTRVAKLAHHHMHLNRLINPSVLRECGYPRSDLGVEITDIVWNQVLKNRQIQVWHRNTDEMFTHYDLKCMVEQILDRKPELPEHKLLQLQVADYPVSPLYLEFARGLPSRYDELIMYHARGFMRSRDRWLLGELFITEATFVMEVEQALALWVQMVAPEFSANRPLRYSTIPTHQCSPGGLTLQEARSDYIGGLMLGPISVSNHRRFETSRFNSMQKIRSIWRCADTIISNRWSSPMTRNDVERLFFLESNFKDRTTQTALDPLAGGRFVPGVQSASWPVASQGPSHSPP